MNVTYSPCYTLVPTYHCFNRCTYCNFRQDISSNSWLEISEAENILQSLSLDEVTEILVLSGEIHPLSSDRSRWFMRIVNLCELALKNNFLPHTNVGILSWEEMKELKKVNVSLGLMLEQVTPKLLETVHKNAPSKKPELRLQQLEWAGKLRIPFTTGILLGIGESEGDRRDTIEAIALLQNTWGHIQEVILQPHSEGSKQSDRHSNFSVFELPKLINVTREILPESITIQIPPNLVMEPNLLLDCLEAGARDLGGISPKDEVNPDYPHPSYELLSQIIEPKGWKLTPRLPVYPKYYSWLSPFLAKKVKAQEIKLKPKPRK